ncbi:MAG: hypothetical protein Q9164_006673, partial [Protoblastenia rupestris]
MLQALLQRYSLTKLKETVPLLLNEKAHFHTTRQPSILLSTIKAFLTNEAGIDFHSDIGRMLRRWNACWYGPVSGRLFGNEPIAGSLIEAGKDMDAMAGTIGAALQAAAASEKNSVATVQFFFYAANNGT